MAEAQASKAKNALRITLKGRIELVTKLDSANGVTFRTLVKTPAPDEWSSPSTFEIRSQGRLGQQGDDIAQECDLRGYSNNYERDDGTKVRSAQHVLQAV